MEEDMKIFRTSDNRIIQLASKKKIKYWPVELPIIYVSYIRENFLHTYGSKRDQKKIDSYLEEVMQEIAIPKLVDGLEKSEKKQVISILKRLEALSRSKPDLIKITIPSIEKKIKDDDKEISKMAAKILKNYKNILKRREINKKLKNLPDDKELDKKLLNGEISNEEYIKLKKKRLELLQEIS
ncbi:MAG: hypothetical protein ACTSU2_01100 [Promethearchaeota archaeon]